LLIHRRGGIASKADVNGKTIDKKSIRPCGLALPFKFFESGSLGFLNYCYHDIKTHISIRLGG